MGRGAHWWWLESWICQRLAATFILLHLCFLCSVIFKTLYPLRTLMAKITSSIKTTFFILTAITIYKHAFCDVSISFWRKVVKFDICTVFHEVQPFSHCRPTHEILVFLSVILWSPVINRGPQEWFLCVCACTRVWVCVFS